MSFTALAGWQAWGLVAGAAALAAGLFFIKLRPPRILIPSLSLWQRVLDASPDLTRWERIRRAVSLVVTIAIALALALAVARPSRVAGAGTAARGRTLVVLDSSWSMLAKTRRGDTRWDRAVAEARRIAAASDQVAVATTSDGLVQGLTDDLVLVESALSQLSPGGADDASWPEVSGVDAVHFVTDGAVPRRVPRSVIVHSVFESVGNVAITAFNVRPSLGPDRRGPAAEVGTAYLEVANFSAKPQKIHITIARGQASMVDTHADLGAGEAYRQLVPLARQGDAALHAHVEAPDNALAIDDDGYAWLARARSLSVAVVGEHTEWLRRLLAGDGDVRATFVSPSAYRGDRDDVVVFDRWAPSSLPPVPALYFAPPPDTPWLRGPEEGSGEERHPRWESVGDHAVLRGVDPLTLRIDRARAYSSSSLEPIAQSTRGTPLIYAGQSTGRRMVVVTFGASDSNLASAPAFPVLMANALDWLARPGARDGALRPGLASFSDATRKVVRQGGDPVNLIHVNGTTVGLLPGPGLYDVETADARSTIVVNAADPQRSNVVRTGLAADANATAAPGALERPWWVAFAVVAFLLAFAEWWTWQRRITV